MVFIICSLSLVVFFYIIYFGKIILNKKKGIKTDQMGIGNKEKILIIQEIIMKISTILIVVVEIVSIVLNLTMLPDYARYIGIVLAIIAVIIFFISVYTMKDSWRAGISNDETKLVTRGIYKISRNPAFLAFDLLYIGVLLMFFNWYLLGMTIFTIIMLHLQILQEEKHLPNLFGEEYITYKQKVFRYFGRRFK